MPRLPAAGAGRKADLVIISTLPGSPALWAGASLLALTRLAARSLVFEDGVKERASGATLSKPRPLCQGVEGSRTATHRLHMKRFRLG